MKLRWLFPGLLIWLFFASMAEAATLQSWRFNRIQNRLEFKTDAGIQPRAQLLFNPTRLVIDLPATRLGRPKQTEQLHGFEGILRVAQFDSDTTRIVVELAPGYTIDPKSVRFRYTSAREWAIDLPRPKFSPLIANSDQLSSQTLDVPQVQDVMIGQPTKPSSRPLFPATTPSLRRPLLPIPNGRPVVVIDPGHGGPDPGAVGIGGLRETDIVLDIGTQVAALLEKQGLTAVLTRNAEYDFGLEPRVEIARRVNATVFVSIHANAISMARPDISGLETYYFQSGKELAEIIHATILEDIGLPDRRVRTARFYVLRYTSMPSVLVETGFVTGADDAAKLSDPGYRSRMAAAIARGILRYLGRSS